MPRIAYLTVPDRSPINIRFVGPNYMPIEGEVIIEGDALPTFNPTPLELQEETARVTVETQKLNDIVTNLPSWSQTDTAITAIGSLADAKVILKKLARVIYWLAKNSAT